MGSARGMWRLAFFCVALAEHFGIRVDGARLSRVDVVLLIVSFNLSNFDAHIKKSDVTDR
jgi:hypothetical protein